MSAVKYKDANVLTYRRYMKWLESLPRACEVASVNNRVSGRFFEYVYRIDGRRGEWVIGRTGEEAADSVIAALPQGNLLKARVFEPLRMGDG